MNSYSDLTNPVIAIVNSRFGMRKHPITGIKKFHNGVDLMCRCGMPVVAPDHAVITEIWDHPDGGRCMAIETPDGTRFGFAHLQKRFGKVHEPVLKGQKIALTGDTGQCTGPHLHFTMKKDGQWVNPQEYFDFRS